MGSKKKMWFVAIIAIVLSGYYGCKKISKEEVVSPVKNKLIAYSVKNLNNNEVSEGKITWNSNWDEIVAVKTKNAEALYNRPKDGLYIIVTGASTNFNYIFSLDSKGHVKTGETKGDADELFEIRYDTDGFIYDKVLNNNTYGYKSEESFLYKEGNLINATQLYSDNNPNNSTVTSSSYQYYTDKLNSSQFDLEKLDFILKADIFGKINKNLIKQIDRTIKDKSGQLVFTYKYEFTDYILDENGNVISFTKKTYYNTLPTPIIEKIILTYYVGV